jgi:hypothetical protein
MQLESFPLYGFITQVHGDGWEDEVCIETSGFLVNKCVLLATSRRSVTATSTIRI